MFEELNEKLVQVKGDLRKKEKWEKQIADYRRELRELKDKIYDFKEVLANEQEDVQKLEGISVTRLFLTVLGRKEERLDKENQEVVAAQLKLHEAKRSQMDIDGQIRELQEKLSKIGDVDSEYQNIIETKERLIKQSQSPYANHLYELSEREGTAKALLTELGEAMSAGYSVNQALTNAVESLEKASGWGTFDLLGGGMISDMVKHDHIDTAKDYIHQAQSRMRSFQKELLDINEEADLQVDISGMLKFADFFFDGLIADWMVQGRINQSLEQTRSKKYEVDSILTKLKSQQQQIERELVSIKEERKHLLETL